MKIAILDLCLPDPGFDRHGSIGDLTRRWVAPHLPEASFDILHIAGGAALPTLGDYDGFMLTGSEKGVYDEADWMAPLKAWLRAARDARTPVFGVCFGHQIMAEAYGGEARNAGAGLVVGAMSYDLGDRTIQAHAVHQDQVIVAPPGAKVAASAAYCPIAALTYDFPAHSIQFHPEYTKDWMRDAVEIFDGPYLDAATAATARASVAASRAPADLWGAETALFFRTHCKTRAEAV